MAADNEPVEITERVTIEPAQGDDDVITPTGDAEGAESEEGDSDTGTEGQPKEQMVRRSKPEPATDKTPADPDGSNEPAAVDGETPRERALRLEVEHLRGLARKDRTNDLTNNHTPAPTKKEMSPEKANILKKYKPEEINSLREVLPVLAEEMGYVRGDQLTAQTYQEKSEAELNAFLEKHPEYLPENDKDNILWGRVKEEFSLYKQPNDPKDLKKILERIHRDIFGIKVAGEGKGAVQAAQRKVQSASHAGASTPARQTNSSKPKQNTSGMRFDMLKGFSDEDIAEMQGE